VDGDGEERVSEAAKRSPTEEMRLPVSRSQARLPMDKAFSVEFGPIHEERTLMTRNRSGN
jgi:hypothetical protein